MKRDVFTFAEEFTSIVRNGIVYLEEYGEGEFPLLHIKTAKQYLALYEYLTGKKRV